MEAILILGIMSLFCSLLISIQETDDDKAYKFKVILMCCSLTFAVFLIAIYVRYATWIDSCNGNNPYKKEYLYKHNIKGEMFVYDSTYVKIK